MGDDVLKRGMAALDSLATILADEARLIASGRTNEGLALAASKAKAAEVVRSAMTDFRALRPGIADASLVAALHRQIETVQETLAMNMAVLATARTVAEGILRDVSQRLATPRTSAYGPGASARAQAAPIVLSRAT